MLPSMKYADKITKSQQVKFGGLNRSVGAGDGELYDMRNLTGDHYPVLSVRAKRHLFRTLAKPGALFAWDRLCWIDGTDFYFDGKQKGQVTEGEKSFAALGAYLVIFPDKCYYNVDTDEFGSLESKWSGESLTFGDGTLYGETAAANAIYKEGVSWADFFRVGDAVTIHGCEVNPGNNMSVIIRAMDGDQMYFYENTFILGADGAAYTETGNLSIERAVPDLNFLCENENRLWGCTETTIYACKLGDIFNWNVYDGLDTDAYAVDSGSAGAFTGCISYRGYPTFFKEDHIFKVYGSVPSNFEVLGSATLGLTEGGGGSLAIAGETLFYLSRNGVMAYTGGIPQPMGTVFGLDRFKKAIGGTDGLKYYVSMQKTDNSWGLYVYDTQTGLWHMEDETQAIGFARSKGNLYMLNSNGELWIVGNASEVPAGTEAEESIPWMAEFCDFTDESPNRKGLSKLQIRLELDPGATVNVWLQFDSDGQWHKVRQTLGEGKKRSCYLPIVPRRADHYRLRLTGAGGCRIFLLTREFYVGSELRSNN